MFETETCHNFEYTSSSDLFELYDALKLLWWVFLGEAVGKTGAINSICGSLGKALGNYPHCNDLSIALDDIIWEFKQESLNESVINIQLANIELLKNLEWGT